jgi:hypothetical protein
MDLNFDAVPAAHKGTNFFEAMARYNSYETLGVWVGPDWQLASLIPWDPILLDF